MSLGIKNWHWRTKGVEKWAREWFTEKLTGLEAGGVKLTKVVDVEGDAELGMRKSKLVTIYDLKVSAAWEAGGAENRTTGIVGCPEVSHDMDEDEYVQEITNIEGADAAAVLPVIKKELWPKITAIFQEFPTAIVQTHGKDLLQTDEPGADAAAAPSSGAGAAPAAAGTAAAGAGAAAGASASGGGSSSAPSAKTSSASSVNTTQVSATGEFMIAAKDLFDLLTNATKVPIWSRNSAQIAPTPGAPVNLFGGNITGTVKSADAPKKIVSSWRAVQWPAGHYGELEALLDQGSSSTTLALRLSGVPVGFQEEAQANLYKYYIQALKQAGLGTVL